MKSIRIIRTLIGPRAAVFGLLAAMTLASSEAQDERGKQLFVNCQACHGADAGGMKLMNAPALSGLSEQYITAQFHKFKDGLRGKDARDTTGLQMAPMTQTLQTDEDIAAVAKYIASLPSTPKEPTLEGGNAEHGKQLFVTCQACHGADAAGNDMMNAPALRNQYDWYLERQLHHFKEGIRGSNPADVTGGQMRPMAMTLADDQAIKDVIAYIQTLSK